MKAVHLERRSLMQGVVSQGVRMTAQRKVLIETIQQAEGHIDAPTLLALARERDPSIDRATVYRTIDLLKRLGLIDELDLMHLTGEKHFYEVKTHQDHLHMACFGCGRIEEFASPLYERLKNEIVRQSGFQLQVVRLEVGGLCKVCAKNEVKTASGADRPPPD